MTKSIATQSKSRSGPVGRAYDEATFKHFLAVDRSRAQRARRFLYLVLVAVRASLGRRATLTETMAAAVFRGLSASVREVDIVGWYQEDKVAAAVLVQGATATGDARQLIAERVLRGLGKHVSTAQANNLRVCVVRLGHGERRNAGI